MTIRLTKSTQTMVAEAAAKLDEVPDAPYWTEDTLL
jgi:hypothetical protein